MAKNIKRMLAMVLVLCMTLSALPMQALAAEGNSNWTETNDGVKTEYTASTSTSTDSSTGNTTVTVEIQQSSSGTSTSTGASVSGSGTSTTTTVKDSGGNVVESSSSSNSSTTTKSESADTNGNTSSTESTITTYATSKSDSNQTTSSSSTSTDTVTKSESTDAHSNIVSTESNTTTSESSTMKNGDEISSSFSTETTTVTTTTDADGNELSSNLVIDGKETSTEQIPVDNVTVKVPTTDKDNPDTEKKDNVNTETVGGPASSTTTGEIDSENGMTTTTVTPGTVTITTTDVTVTETVVEKVVDESGNIIQGTDLDYVYNETKPVGGENDNELVIWVYKGNRTEIPKEGEEIVVEEGYEYKYLGSGNTSQYLPVYLYGEPATPDEEPVYVDENGKKYYVHDQGIADYDKSFIGGEAVNLESIIPGTFGVAQQFTLVDAVTGELITAYCADAKTPTVKNYGYNIENLEDATYYTDEQAAMIRSIAKNGYWGTASGEDGSLDSMKASLSNAKDENGNPLFTEEELALVTDGMALTATQMAIWTFSNHASDMNFFSALYTNEGDTNGELKTSWASQLVNRKAEKDDSYVLLYKLYDYMINLEPTPAGEDAEKPTTEDTIINEQNFLKDMSVTVIEKADHANNYDNKTDNDAYVTNLTFALVVTPSSENGDDLVVSVVDPSGNVIASGRIAGEAAEGENILIPDANGNYCFEGITMIEGEQNFKLNLSGIQNLKEGVYLYSSEVKDDTSSQTLVGIAGGKHSVNVAMDITFDLDVEEGVVATERVWHYESDPGFTPPDGNEPTPAVFRREGRGEAAPAPQAQVFRLNNQDNLVEIPEEPVPLATPVVTGDNSGLWIAVILMSVLCMVAINVFDKKKQHETF